MPQQLALPFPTRSKSVSKRGRRSTSLLSGNAVVQPDKRGKMTRRSYSGASLPTKAPGGLSAKSQARANLASGRPAGADWYRVEDIRRTPVTDSLIVIHKGTPPGTGSGGALSSATASAAGAAAGGAAGAAGKGLLRSVATSVGGYIAAGAATKLATKGLLKLASFTPVGRAAKIGYVGYKTARALQKVGRGKDVTRALLSAGKEIIF